MFIRKITKREFMGSMMLRKTTLGKSRGFIGYALTEIKNKPYNITVKVDNKKIKISYGGVKFGVDELRGTENKEGYIGGNGKEILTKSDLVNYYYEKGINNWEVSIESTVEDLKEFRVTNQRCQSEIIFYVEKLYSDNKDFYKELGAYDCSLEIVSNIVYHNNIITKGNIFMWTIMKYIKYVFMEGYRRGV